MANKIIPPLRSEALTSNGRGGLRFMLYLEQTAEGVNDSNDALGVDPSSISISSASIAAINKKLVELLNDQAQQSTATIANLGKRIKELENVNTNAIDAAVKKRLSELENDSKTEQRGRFSRLKIDRAALGNATVKDKLNLPVDNDAANPTVNFGDSGYYAESVNVLAVSIDGVKRFSFDETTLTTPNGDWDNAGININTGDTYRINSFDVLSITTLGFTVTSSSLTSVGTLTAVNTSGAYSVGGTQVVGSQGAAVADPTGGAVIDAECRAQLIALSDRMQAHGLIA